MSSIAVVKRDCKWWIIDPDDPEPIGPYETRAEAESDARGIRRFVRYSHLPGFVTTAAYAAMTALVYWGLS